MTDLERELRGLATAVAFPETPEIAGNVRLEPRSERRGDRSWRTIAAVATLVIAVAVATGLAAVPQARTSILHLFGLGEVRVEFVDRLPEVRPGAPLDLGTAIDPADAPFPVLRPSLLGEPDGIYRSGDVVTLLYGTSTRVRALITEIADSGFTPAVGKKLVAVGTRVEFVPVNGSAEPALWITGAPHVVHLPGGPGRLAGNTLIWTQGRLTIRLEGAETLQQARAIAASLG
jgi:hypothetical protein